MARVLIKIPSQLRAATGGNARLAVRADTVGQALTVLFEHFPEARERITYPGGQPGSPELRRFVNIYVAGEDIRFLEGLATAVTDGDDITILPAVAGG